MLLVLLYTESDGCTYSADHIHPIEYESVEALYVDFNDGIKKAASDRTTFTFKGEEFYPDIFFSSIEDSQYKRYLKENNSILNDIVKLPYGYVLFTPAEVMPLLDWFEANKLEG